MTIKDNLLIIDGEPVKQWVGRFGYPIQGIIIHSTAGSYGGTLAWFKNMKDPKARVSAHFVVSDSGEISKCVVEENAAWHAGLTDESWNYLKKKGNIPKLIQDNWSINPNFYSIGTEVVDNGKKNWNYPTIQWEAVVELTAFLCKKHNIPISRDYILMHKEVDPLNKRDPHGAWNHDKFIQDVRLMADKILSPQPVYVHEGWVTVRDEIHSLFVRSGPARMYPQAGCKILYPGNKVEVTEFVEGEKIAYTVEGKLIESCYWWKSKLGHYFWAGGTLEQPGLKSNDAILNLKEEVNKDMTPEENAAKVAEFQARKVALEARRAELDEAYKVNEADFEAYNKDYEAFIATPVVEVPQETPAEVPAEAVAEVPVEPVVAEVAVEESDESMFAKFKEWLKANK